MLSEFSYCGNFFNTVTAGLVQEYRKYKEKKLFPF